MFVKLWRSYVDFTFPTHGYGYKFCDFNWNFKQNERVELSETLAETFQRLN